MEIVINRDYGGFSLSLKGLYTYCLKKYGSAYIYEVEGQYHLIRVPYSDTLDRDKEYAVTPKDFGEEYFSPFVDQIFDMDIERNDPALVETVKELGDKANGLCASLAIEEIDDKYRYRWEIDSDDGWESVQILDK